MVEVDWAVSDKGKSGQPDHGGGKEDYRFRGPLSGGERVEGVIWDHSQEAGADNGRVYGEKMI